MNSISKKIKQYALPGVITLAITVVILILKGMWPFGANRIDYFDNMLQVAPIYTHLWDVLHGKADLWFDWYTALGTNLSMTVSAFSMLSPFNILLFFIPRNLILESFSIFVTVKMIFMAVAMYAYMDKKYESLRYGLKVLMSVMYAFCGYTLLYSSCFMPWMDVVALFPLLMLAYERMMESGKKLFYICMMALVFIINYYVSAMAVLYILVLSAAYIFIRCEKDKRKSTVWNLGIGTATGIGLSAAVLLPVLVQLAGSQRGTGETAGVISQYMEWLTSNFISYGVRGSVQRWAMIYGMALVIAIIIIGVKKYNNDKKMLKYNLVIIGATLSCLFIECTNIIWHFGSYNGYPLRNGFFIAFTLISVAGYYGQMIFKEKKEVDKKVLVGQCLFALAYIVAFILVHNFLYEAWGLSAVWLIVAEVAIMTYVYVKLLTAGKDEPDYKKVIVFVMAELFVGAYALIGPPISYEYLDFDKGDFVQYANEVKDAFDIEASATDRIAVKDMSLNANYPIILRRGALSSFTAALQSDTQQSAYNLGYTKYFLWSLDTGGTVFTEALLHVTQVLNSTALDEGLYVLKDTHNEYKLYDSKYVLPFATAVNKELANAEFGEDIMQNHNTLYGALVGGDDKIMTVPKYEFMHKVTEKGGVGDYAAAEDGFRDIYTINVEGKQLIYINVQAMEDEEGNSYEPHLQQRIQIYKDGRLYMIPDIGDSVNTRYMNEFCNNLVYLGCFEDETITIEVEYNLTKYPEQEKRQEIYDNSKTNILALDMDKMDALVESYDSTYCKASYTNNSLIVNIKGDANNNMALIPVIYSDNWSVTVNGKAVEGKAIAGLFTGVELQEGDNTIVMQFSPKGKKIGLVISLAVLVILCACVVVNRIKTIKIPAWVQNAAYGIYTGLCAVIAVVMFIVPAVTAIPALIMGIVRWFS